MQQDLIILKQEKNNLQKLLLKRAHMIKLLQNRKQIDYDSIDYNCREYAYLYTKYKSVINTLKQLERSLGN